MQKFLDKPAATAQPTVSKWGDLNGVRLTKADKDQQYESDSLSTTLENQDRGRHVARVAQLYFARMNPLPMADLEIHLLALIKKIFGPCPMIGNDWGWLGSISYSDLPKSLRHELNRDLDSTFDETKWDAERLKAFRVFQLLLPGEPKNLFEVIYCRPNGPFLYLFPTLDLPPRTKALLELWLAGTVDVYVPELYVQICGDPPTVVDGSLQLQLNDWFTLRFLNWFTGCAARSSSEVNVNLQSQPSSSNKIRSPFHAALLLDVTAGNPPLELLQCYLQVFLPHVQEGQRNDVEMLSPRARAIFRWSIVDLWLNRIKLASTDPTVPPPSLRLLRSLFVLITHIASDPGLCKESDVDGEMRLSQAFLTFRVALHRFFLWTLTEVSFEGDSSFDSIIDLWNVYLSPWKAMARSKGHERPLERLLQLRHSVDRPGQRESVKPQWLWFIVHNYRSYLIFLHKTLERLDQESNPSLEALEALARTFAPDGPFSPFVLGALLGCEYVMLGADGGELPDSLAEDHDAKQAYSFVKEWKQAVRTSVQVQYDELGLRNASGDYPSERVLTPVRHLIKSFVRELNHKRQVHHQSFAVTGLLSTGHVDLGKDLQGICKIFQVTIDEKPSDSLSGSSDSQKPVFEWKKGLPSWLSASTTKSVRFRGLTAEGQRKIARGLLEGNQEIAAQFLGDYTRRPIQLFEVPSLVNLAIMLNESVERFAGVQIDLRPFADSRNILWIVFAFEVLVFFKLDARFGWWSAAFALYCMGAGVLRGLAEKLWAVLFGALSLYFLWTGLGNSAPA